MDTDNLLMILATPGNVDEACNTLTALCDPTAHYLRYLETRARVEPHNAAFLGRVAGNVRKVDTLR